MCMSKYLAKENYYKAQYEKYKQLYQNCRGAIEENKKLREFLTFCVADKCLPNEECISKRSCSCFLKKAKQLQKELGE